MTSEAAQWLVRTSWQASILILLTGLILRALRNQIPARWRYAIWFLVALRLLLPAMPASSFSIFNYIQPSGINVLSAKFFGAHLPGTGSASATTGPVHLPEPDQEMDGSRRSVQLQGANVSGPSASLPQILLGVWICGVLYFGFRVFRQDLLFERKLQRTWMVTDSRLLELLEECRNKLNIGFPIPLLETREVDAPALYGALHPRLLVPEGILKSFDVRELRHVFMHELAHAKRRDLVTHWMLTVIQLVHWFNPLVWLAMRRAATERELACDALALSHIQDEGERESYGHTLIKLLERFVKPVPMLGGVGMLEKGGVMKERITMIADFRPRKNWPAFGVSFLLVLAMFGFTEGRKTLADIPDLTVWWPADGNFLAARGMNPGIGRGGVTFSGGKVGSAFDLDGSTQFVEVPNSPALNFRESFTISVWIQPRKDQAGVIISKWGDRPNEYNNRAYSLLTLPDLGLRFSISDLKNQWNPLLHNFDTKHQVLALNKWNHVVASYDKPSGCRRIYVDGILVGERRDPPVNIIETDVSLGIGASIITRDGRQSRQYFDGKIDEVRFYSRALTLREVEAIHEAGLAKVN